MALLKQLIMLQILLKIKNCYTTNAALNSRLNDSLEKKYVDDEVKKFNHKVSTKSSKILYFNYKIQQKETNISSLERDISYFKEKDY